MQEVFHEAVKQLNQGDPVVMATVVHTKGSTPQKPGAKLLVRQDGSGVGTLGGGCVEGDIWFAASQLLKRGGGPQYRDYQLTEELAAQDGLVCGGTMFFVIDPVYAPSDYLTFAQEIESAYSGGPSVAMATLIDPGTDNTTSVGTKLFIRENGETEGSLGTADLDVDAAGRARELMSMGKNERVKFKDGSEYFIEAYTTPPQLVLFGAGHVSKAIAPLAKSLGFRVFVTDDREEFANHDRFPEADMIVTDEPSVALPQLPVNSNTFVIIATRGHRNDNVALELAARTSARYVGLLGSKRKTILIYEDLLNAGVPVDRVREIRSPIGLDIGARTPEEIAVSILSEILMFRLGGTGSSMQLSDQLLERIVAKSKAHHLEEVHIEA